jgi:hypothetical protein
VDPLFDLHQHANHCVGFLVKLNCLLSVLGPDKKFHPPPVSTRLHHEEIPDSVLDSHERRYCLHHLDGAEFHIRLCSSESILDQRRRKVHQPVCDVVVSLCY